MERLIKVLPLITLGICLVVLGVQQASLSSRTESIETLRSRVAEAKRPPAAAGSTRPATSGSLVRKSGREGTGAPGDSSKLESLNLTRIAEAFVSSRGGELANMKLMLQLRSLALESTAEELQALIEEAGSLEIPDQVKRSLIGELLGGLVEHDPEAALALALQSEHVDFERERWRFRQAFSKWLESDSAAAAAWFDRELAKGTFETRSLGGHARLRSEFESTLVGSLLTTDPAQARDRLLDLSDEQRREILGNGGHFKIQSGNGPAHAALVRATVAEDQQGPILASANRDFLQQHDYDELAAYASEIEASPAERTAIVREAVKRQFERFGWENKPPTSESVVEMHDFVRSQAPGEADRIVGESLGSYGRTNENHFETAAALLEGFEPSASSDDLIAGFLDSSGMPPKHAETARRLAEQIQDPSRREGYLGRLNPTP